jgi:hypothetical protein
VLVVPVAEAREMIAQALFDVGIDAPCVEADAVLAALAPTSEGGE